MGFKSTFGNGNLITLKLQILFSFFIRDWALASFKINNKTYTKLQKKELTKNGKLLVGNEIRNWLESLLPVKELETCNFGGCSTTSLEGDGEGSGDLFGLDDYGRTLQPAMTPELEDKISQSVSDAYNKNIKN